MSQVSDCTQELAFFGKVTASVTHELKNYLALINEYNGLLSDLVMAHEMMGRELDLARLKSLCGDVKRQVTAGGAVLDHLNGFAHSVDQTLQDVDLRACLNLFVALSRRNATRRGVDLELLPPEENMTLRTQSFMLLRALWLALEVALGGCQAGARLSLRVRREPGRVLFCFAGAESPAGEDALPAALLLALGAGFSCQDPGEMALSLPIERP